MAPLAMFPPHPGSEFDVDALTRPPSAGGSRSGQSSGHPLRSPSRQAASSTFPVGSSILGSTSLGSLPPIVPPVPHVPNDILNRPATATRRRSSYPRASGACIPCRKRHLGCDNQRPCLRCSYTRREEECHDEPTEKQLSRLQQNHANLLASTSFHAPPPALGGTFKAPLPPLRPLIAAAGTSLTASGLPPLPSVLTSGLGPSPLTGSSLASTSSLSAAPVGGLSSAPKSASGIVRTTTMVLGTDMRIAKVSDEALKMFGYHSHEMIGHLLTHWIHPEEKGRFNLFYDRLAKSVGIKTNLSVPVGPAELERLDFSEVCTPLPGGATYSDIFRFKDFSRIYGTYDVRIHLGGYFGASLAEPPSMQKAIVIARLTPIDLDELSGLGGTSLGPARLLPPTTLAPASRTRPGTSTGHRRPPAKHSRNASDVPMSSSFRSGLSLPGGSLAAPAALSPAPLSSSFGSATFDLGGMHRSPSRARSSSISLGAGASSLAAPPLRSPGLSSGLVPLPSEFGTTTSFGGSLGSSLGSFYQPSGLYGSSTVYSGTDALAPSNFMLSGFTPMNYEGLGTSSSSAPSSGSSSLSSSLSSSSLAAPSARSGTHHSPPTKRQKPPLRLPSIKQWVGPVGLGLAANVNYASSAPLGGNVLDSGLSILPSSLTFDPMLSSLTLGSSSAGGGSGFTSLSDMDIYPASRPMTALGNPFRPVSTAPGLIGRPRSRVGSFAGTSSSGMAGFASDSFSDSMFPPLDPLTYPLSSSPGPSSKIPSYRF